MKYVIYYINHRLGFDLEMPSDRIHCTFETKEEAQRAIRSLIEIDPDPWEMMGFVIKEEEEEEEKGS